MNSADIKSLNIDGITTGNQQLITVTFNNYSVSIAENINTNMGNIYTHNKYTPNIIDNNTSLQYVREAKKSRYTKFQHTPTTTSEI